MRLMGLKGTMVWVVKEIHNTVHVSVGVLLARMMMEQNVNNQQTNVVTVLTKTNDHIDWCNYSKKKFTMQH
jgi:uncharacterized membrane-anchored protein YhcB (DUF1043 family)